jgi:hypothetical protein
LTYSQAFREARGGEANAELVWLPEGYQEGTRLGGRVVLKRLQWDVDEETSQAREHGAAGVILVVRYMGSAEREPPSTGGPTLPVVVISEDTQAEILRLAAITPYEARNAPPALLLPLRAQIAVPYAPPQRTEAPTVVGLLPGSQLGAEPLIIAAHYDGVGMSPDGILYPGANNNAAGVAVMLELARVWRSSGYKPMRSIYLVAWGAEEHDLASARYYLQHPIIPLQRTRGLLSLDRVGQARSYYLNLDGDAERAGELLYALSWAGELLDRRVSAGVFKGSNAAKLFGQQASPAVLLFWPDASYIHTPEDIPDSLEPYKLATTGEVLALAVMIVAQ